MVTLYECDPKKNKECKKTGCYYDPVNPGPCRLTTHKEYERSKKRRKAKKDEQQGSN